MAEERGEMEQASLRIETRAIPTEQSADRKRVPQVMQMRSRDALGNHEVQSRHEVMECLCDGAGMDRAPLGERKERGLAQQRPHVCRSIGGKRSADLRTERHQPGLSELRLADDEDLPLKIHVSDGESRDLTDAEAKTIEQREHHAVRRSSVRRASIVGQRRGEVEQPSRRQLVEDERYAVASDARNGAWTGEAGTCPWMTNQSKHRARAPRRWL